VTAGGSKWKWRWSNELVYDLFSFALSFPLLTTDRYSSSMSSPFFFPATIILEKLASVLQEPVERFSPECVAYLTDDNHHQAASLLPVGARATISVKGSIDWNQFEERLGKNSSGILLRYRRLADGRKLFFAPSAQPGNITAQWQATRRDLFSGSSVYDRHSVPMTSLDNPHHVLLREADDISVLYSSSRLFKHLRESLDRIGSIILYLKVCHPSSYS
jgi:hypothetical protein